MSAVRSVTPERGGYILGLDDGRELRIRTGQDPRADMLAAAVARYLETHPGGSVQIRGPDAS